VAGERHAAMLKDSIRDPDQWLGAILRNPAMQLPERHLGLTVASEVVDALARLDAAADALAMTPLGQLSKPDLKRWEVAFELDGSAALANFTPLAGRTVAVARDAAFCFVYAANLDCLRELGAKLVYFSPLVDPALPECDAVWLPGGYPELHAQKLGANTSLRDDLCSHVAQGKPVWAECGGMMVLFDALVDAEGERHAQWGLLPGTVTMQNRLAALGPQQLVVGGDVLRGHTFHYSTCATPLSAQARTSRPDTLPVANAGEAVYKLGSIRASYFHAWFASSPVATAALFGGLI
jgi:cobyrinic acid a,c-diamide synthase